MHGQLDDQDLETCNNKKNKISRHMIGNGMLSITIHVVIEHFQLPTMLVPKIYQLLYAWRPKAFHSQSCGD